MCWCICKQTSSEFGIFQVTVSVLGRSRAQIEDAVADSTSVKQKELRISKNETVKIALIQWFRQGCVSIVPISEHVTKEKAHDLALVLGNEEIKVPNG